MKRLTIGLVDDVPTRNTIDNWTRKCGLDEMKHTPEVMKETDYAMIIDECMMIGSEKLLPVLAVPSEHQGHPLQQKDVRVIGFNVQSSWTAQTVSETLDVSVKTMGKDPEFVITDNDHKVRNAVALSGYTWHRDVSHTLAMFMERTYKEDTEYVNFNKKMATCKKQYCMKEIAYLQSPSQRCKARFMNISLSVDWAARMLDKWSQLTSHERKVFSYIRKYASFIEEMKKMVSCIQFIETEMKYRGLSKDTISVCKEHVLKTIMCGNERMRNVGKQILDYLSEEYNLLDDNKTINNSSDIIESTFGIFKYKQSPNKLNGVTTFVLHIPAILALADKNISDEYNIKERLCRNRIKDIFLWRDENLQENLVAKRIKVLKTA